MGGGRHARRALRLRALWARSRWTAMLVEEDAELQEVEVQTEAPGRGQTILLNELVTRSII